MSASARRPEPCGRQAIRQRAAPHDVALRRARPCENLFRVETKSVLPDGRARWFAPACRVLSSRLVRVGIAPEQWLHHEGASPRSLSGLLTQYTAWMRSPRNAKAVTIALPSERRKTAPTLPFT